MSQLVIYRIFQYFGLSAVHVDRTLTPSKSPWVVAYIFGLVIGFSLLYIDGFRDEGVVPLLKELARLLTDVIVYALTCITLTAIFIQVLRTRESQVKLFVLLNEVDFLASTRLKAKVDAQSISRSVSKLIFLTFLFVLQECGSAFAVFEMNQYVSYWYVSSMRIQKIRKAKI